MSSNDVNNNVLPIPEGEYYAIEYNSKEPVIDNSKLIKAEENMK